MSDDDGARVDRMRREIAARILVNRAHQYFRAGDRAQGRYWMDEAMKVRTER